MSSHAHTATCPRCGTKTLEVLKTHSHCLECLYFENYYEDFDTSVTNALLAEKFLKSAVVHSLPSRKKKKSNEAAS